MKDGQNGERNVIELLLRALVAALGYDNSESATEQFTQQLFDAASHALKDMRDSHDEGLCLDCVAALTEYLNKVQ